MAEIRNEYPHGVAMVQKAVKQALGELGFEIRQETEDALVAKRGMSWRTWGQEILVNFERRGDHTEVLIKTEAMALIDWGEGEELASHILANLDALRTESRASPDRTDVKMAKSNRIFIAFAAEDKHYRDFLVGQARNGRSPFDFIDMSVKEPWDSNWKANCRTKIKGCDGMIALISPNTPRASGQLWEIKCAREEAIPVVGMYVQATGRPALPAELYGVTIIDWTWEGIAKWLDGL